MPSVGRRFSSMRLRVASIRRRCMRGARRSPASPLRAFKSILTTQSPDLATAVALAVKQRVVSPDDVIVHDFTESKDEVTTKPYTVDRHGRFAQLHRVVRGGREAAARKGARMGRGRGRPAAGRAKAHGKAEAAPRRPTLADLRAGDRAVLDAGVLADWLAAEIASPPAPRWAESRRCALALLRARCELVRSDQLVDEAEVAFRERGTAAPRAPFLDRLNGLGAAWRIVRASQLAATPIGAALSDAVRRGRVQKKDEHVVHLVAVRQRARW